MNKPKSLAFGKMKESDFLVRRYTAMIPIDHTLEDVERLGYFDHHLTQLAKIRAFGPVRLEIISDDCSIHASYMIMEANRGGVRLRREAVYSDAMVDEKDDRTVLNAGASDNSRFTMKFAGPFKYRIFEYGKMVAHMVQSKDMVIELIDNLNDGQMTVADIPEEYAAPEVAP